MSGYNKIFISYAKEDFHYAEKLYQHLETLSYVPWLDKKDLLPGSNWELEINRALINSDFIILLLSSISVSKRGYVQKEYKLALQYWEKRLEDDIYIIPVLIDECKVPDSLNRFQWIMFDEAFPSIIHSLEKQRNTILNQTEEKQDYTTKRNPLQSFNGHVFTEYDITLITLMAQGLLQKDIPGILQECAMFPASLSSVEKRLNIIREALSFSRNEQLIVFCKDTGII